jgi:hypothetical protein
MFASVFSIALLVNDQRRKENSVRRVFFLTPRHRQEPEYKKGI